MEIVRLLDRLDLYWRVHWADCPDFSAGTAYSAPWGAERCEDDPSRYRCVACDGAGVDYTDLMCGTCRGSGCAGCDGTGVSATCVSCAGEGSIECDPGYSACTSAEDLRSYFQGREPDPGEQVLVFEGELAGYGLEGEPLVIPTQVVARTTWGELTRLLEEVAA